MSIFLLRNLALWKWFEFKVENGFGFFFVSGKRVERVELGCHWAIGYLWKFANQKFNKFFDSILCFCYASLFQLEFRLTVFFFLPVSLMSFVFICISYYTILHMLWAPTQFPEWSSFGFVWQIANNAQNCSAEQFNIIKSDCCPENICGH